MKNLIDKSELISKLQTLEGLTVDERSSLIGLLREHKKYGLVWEDKPEDVEERLRESLPVLREVKNKAILSREPDAPNHILIEGDNLEALTTLSYTHEGKIDVIYIDPPYNTGAKNWKYNNDYVDNNDAFKHSKWISMMNKRLKIAKRLLSDRGILVLTIDDYEIENITLLLNEIFGEDNRLGTVVIRNNPSGRSTTSGFSIAHEYALFYAKSHEDAVLGRLERTEEQIGRYKEKDDIGKYEWVNFRARYSTNSASMQYPIYIKKDGSDFRIPSMKYINGEYKVFEDVADDEYVELPIDGNGKLRSWKWSIETLLEKKATDIGIRLDQGKKYTIYAKSRLKDEGMLPLTWWEKSEYSATSMGNNLLANILGGKLFDYPKSLYAVIDSLKVANADTTSTILDFFAGSGTTLHATMQLNAEDGGHRQCILVTNNENGICENVTYERNKRVIEGYTTPKGAKVEGLKRNTLRYYKTDFIPRERTQRNMRALVAAATDLLCIKEDLYEELTNFGRLKLRPQLARYFDNGRKHMLIVYREELIDELVEEIRSLPPAPAQERGKLKVYVFSPGRYPFTDNFREVEDKVELVALPAAIYDAYQKVLPKRREKLFAEEEKRKETTIPTRHD
ncbi:MAG: site-specific DNA-methyltransferase [Prevotella sp.]|nr:site-specific DNA-methyltransferase [Prevotella sp.]